MIYEYVPAWLLLVVLGMIVLHAPLTVFLGSQWPAIATGVKAWKEVLIVVAGLIVIADVTRRRKWGELASDKLFWLIVGYVLLHMLAAIWSSTGLASIMAGLAIDLRYVAYFAIVYAYLMLYPAYRQSFIKVGIVGAIIVVGFACLQLLLPKDALTVLGYSDSTIAPYGTIDKNPDYIRVNSTMRGPNPLGAYAGIVLACVVAYAVANTHRLRAGRLRWIIGAGIVASVIALWISYSRSALVAAIVAVGVVLAAQHMRRLTDKRSLVALAVGTLLVVALGVAVRNTSFVQNVILHDNPSTGAMVDSNEAHVDSLSDGTVRMLAQPFGAGIGSTGSASLFGDKPLIIENQYLLIAHEVGWLGITLFAMIYAILIHRLWQHRQEWLAVGLFASGIGLALIGILLPVWVDDTVSIIWWGLVAVVLAKGVKRGTKTNKKAA